MGLQLNTNGGHLRLTIKTKIAEPARDHSLSQDAAPRNILPLIEDLEKANLPTDELEREQSIEKIRSAMSSLTPSQSKILHEKFPLFCSESTEPNALGEYTLFTMSEYGEPGDIALLKEQGVSLTAIDHRPEEPPTPLLKAVVAHNRSTAVTIARELAHDHAFDALGYEDQNGKNALNLALELRDEPLIKALIPIYQGFQPQAVTRLLKQHQTHHQSSRKSHGQQRLSVLA